MAVVFSWYAFGSFQAQFVSTVAMRNEKLHTHSRVMNARMRSRRLQGSGVSLAHVLTALKSTASVQHFSLTPLHDRSRSDCC